MKKFLPWASLGGVSPASNTLAAKSRIVASIWGLHSEYVGSKPVKEIREM